MRDCQQEITGRTEHQPRTSLDESNGDKIKQLGRWWYFVPEHTACDDENIAKDEYEKAQIQLKVRHRYIFWYEQSIHRI
jgi:hypothetical protein